MVLYVLPPYVAATAQQMVFGHERNISKPCVSQAVFAKYVLILSGDHIYKMNYAAMLRCHIEKQADATIAVLGTHGGSAPLPA